MKKRWRYYIDKEFQNQFIVKFSIIIILNTFITLALLWMIREKSYNLLPENASVLVQVDVQKAIPLAIYEGKLTVDPENGKNYFPLKMINNKPPKLYNAFDLYFFPILGTSVLNVLIVSIFSIFFSHKMAGPIRKIKNTLEDFNHHKPVKKIQLRKSDFFKDLAELINKAIFKESDTKQ